MKRYAFSVLVSCLILIGLPSVPKVRSFLARPLVTTDSNAAGDACYVLAAGGAFQERLAAASDLYHMSRVRKILMMRDDNTASYNFTAKSSWTATQWAASYLEWRGIPQSDVIVINHVEGPFGTLAEAKNIALALPKDVKRLVLVSSAPHMRRTMLAFRRVLPESVILVPYAASSFETSYEMYHPLWLEYLKLSVYLFL